MKFLVLFLLLGCGYKEFANLRDFDHYERKEMDDAFIEYVEAFEFEALERGYDDFIVDVPIIFLTIPQDFFGKCSNGHLNSSFHFIAIDKGKWDVLRFHERELLIFHELGHCILNLKHKPDTIMAKHLVF